ncbi:hypothetical protein [Maribacter flavus]|uniref:Type II secretion system protein n=1 Tax=Maribacter flavus TaxID=1658664 RepID=A0A5B2TPU1_9FLAO|nr:hypothetical protein [Maribacter flavus]KAA2216572.1 hypothetical protein F0361_11245 [Maribacter flavus]
MALLKKIKASSLMETLVATVLIVIIFMVSSLVLNNIVTNNIRNNTEKVAERLVQLEYAIHHRALEVPFLETFGDWEIEISNQGNTKDNRLLIKAFNTRTNKEISKSVLIEGQNL